MPEPSPNDAAAAAASRAGLLAQPAGLFALALLAIVWSWWAWQDGAWFGVVLFPGLIVLCAGAAVLALVAPWRVNLGLSRAVGAALGGLVALGLWSLLSALWSPAPDVALTDGQRILGYALAFALGLALCSLLAPRAQLSLAPLAIAGAFAGLATVVVLLGGDEPRRYLEIDGTLVFPLGYRNATAAFFAIALFPALGLAAERTLDWRARGLAAGAATLCAGLVVLAQSRGSIIGLAAGLAAYALLSPLRLRALSWLALIAVPALVVILPLGSELYTTASDAGVRNVGAEMQAAGTGLLAIALGGTLLGALVALAGERLPGLGSVSTASNRVLAFGMAGIAALAAVLFVLAVGNPIDWFGDRIEEVRKGGSPELSGETRFSLSARSDRNDVWRVALNDAAGEPLLGEGGGGFQYSYMGEREVSYQYARDAHSAELEVLGELGMPGLLLLFTALGGAALGIARARRTGPAAATLATIAAASGAYWLAHASIDWFWGYAGLTAPVFALLGSACAPAVTEPRARRVGARRGLLVAALAVLALSAVPFFLSERYLDDAFERWRADPERAFDDLDRAAALNPWSDTPLLAEGEIARLRGEREGAIAAFREATERRPEEWAGHVRLAQLLERSDPDAARAAAARAIELDPIGDRTRAVARQLGLPVPPRP